MFERDLAILFKLWHWADQRSDVRTVVLAGSHGNPGKRPDAFSDFDLDVFVDDAATFAGNDEWWKGLGRALVRWPLEPRTTFSSDWITQLILFEEGFRVDFQITNGDVVQINNDAGLPCVLYHRRVASFRLAAVGKRTAIAIPSEADYIDRMNAFWWDITYVPKALDRHELLYARFVLDTDIRLEKLHPLLRWHVGIRHGWETEVGIFDRWMRQYVDSEIWSLYLKTFAPGTIDDTWQAMFHAIELVRLVGHDIADELGFQYPESTDERVIAYIQRIRGQSQRDR